MAARRFQPASSSALRASAQSLLALALPLASQRTSSANALASSLRSAAAACSCCVTATLSSPCRLRAISSRLLFWCSCSSLLPRVAAEPPAQAQSFACVSASSRSSATTRKRRRSRSSPRLLLIAEFGESLLKQLSKTIEYVAQEGDCGAEWVRVAARALPQLRTVSKAKRERKHGALLLNGERLAPTNVRLALGDRIHYHIPATAAAGGGDEQQCKRHRKCLAVCVAQGLRVVYDSATLAVVVKPAGIHVKGRGVRTVENALPLLLLPPAEVEVTAAGEMPPRAVHRLDARVGGVLLVAKTREAETTLTAQFESRRVLKQYRAIVVGRMDPDELEDSCGFPGTAQLLRSVGGEVRLVDALVGGKRSCSAARVASYSRSERYGWITTVDLWPLTGRKHQLRVHMAHIGHPIVGDDLYPLNSSECAAVDDDNGRDREGGMDNCDDGDDDDEGDGNESGGDDENDERGGDAVVRGLGLFLFAVGVKFDDCRGNRRSFALDEPPKFARFRHFCAYNWEKKSARRAEEAARHQPQHEHERRDEWEHAE